MRIGFGYDVHKFEEGRKLIIGGIRVPYEKGLAGHSDADVLLHAISDAILGAAGLGDIGLHFPDTDEAFKGADSGVLLKECADKARKAGYEIGNIDAVVVAQEPKLKPFIDDIRDNIAGLLDVESGCINVKATTEEGLGFTGEKKGMAANAVCLLV